MESDYHFRLATPSDVDELGVIGPAIYAESYSHMWDNPEAYAKQLATFSSSAVAKFNERSDTKTWITEYQSQIIGFLSIVIGAPDPVEGRTDGIEIPRIYFLSPARGKGLAAKLMAKADDYAREVGANHLWLDAMKEAPWAWQTYRKWGFSEIGQTMFLESIKPAFKSMIVMRRSL
ncbi:MAG: GNAT family N-acetyltransferase [Hyphomonadaceae bacterium]